MRETHLNIQGLLTDTKNALPADKSGHGIEHVARVHDMAIRFGREIGADLDVVALAALLHDLDDYKLVGHEAAEKLTNARTLLAKYALDETMSKRVVEIIQTMGYSKYLEGVRPTTIEGMVLSDADMCDAIGATGILRTHAYAIAKGNEFYVPDYSPLDAELDPDAYKNQTKTHSVQHFFDKLLKIPDIMMTEPGRKEAAGRKKIMVDFLRQYFTEQNAQEWLEHLDAYEAHSQG